MTRVVRAPFRAAVLLAFSLTGCAPLDENAAQVRASRDSTESPSTLRSGVDSLIIPGVRIGAITVSTSEAELIRIYGLGAVVRDSVYVGEGFFEPGTLVFPNTAAELEIIWQDTSARCPRYVIARKPKAPWTTLGGVRIGALLRDVVRENGRAFKFSGFDWDYQGYVTEWGGGTLEGLSVRFELPSDSGSNGDTGELGRLAGDRQLSSDDALVVRVQPVVYQIGVSWSLEDPEIKTCRNDRS